VCGDAVRLPVRGNVGRCRVFGIGVVNVDVGGEPPADFLRLLTRATTGSTSCRAYAATATPSTAGGKDPTVEFRIRAPMASPAEFLHLGRLRPRVHSWQQSPGIVLHQ
jgi:hypothetical protein